jgi:DnaA family protein
MTQLLLDLEPPRVPTLDNFVVGRNAEVLAALRHLCTTVPEHPSARCLYLWGPKGSGRSHLAAATCSLLGGSLLVGSEASAADVREAAERIVDGAPDVRRMLAVDGVEQLNADAQEALFHAINLLRDDPRGALLVTGGATPRDLFLKPGRDDLRSRLAWGLVYQLHRLDDSEKDAALEQRAEQQGFPLTPEVRRYLLTHFSRDLGSLMRMVDALDRHAREHRRIVTVPLIREFLQRPIDLDAQQPRLGNLA